MKIERVLLFAGVGAALMYFLDPENGERRRAMLRDQASNLMITADNLMEQRGEFASRAREALIETKRLVDNQIEALEEDENTASSATGTQSAATAPKKTRTTRTSTSPKTSGA